MGVARAPMSLSLGPWKWPALAFCSAVVLAAMAIPVGVLLYWAIRGLLAGESVTFLSAAALNSVYASALAAGVTLLAAFPVTVLSVRYPGWFATVVERASYIGFALPGIAVALSLVFFGIRYATPLYQSMALLIFAYAVLFLPTAIGAGRTRLLQVSPQLEEAARVLGKRPWQVFLTVTVPLMRPGLLAGAGLVFLLTMKELPATLILGPLGFRTLATSIWSSSSEAFFARAAIQSLLLVAVSSLSVALIFLQQKRSA